MTRNAPTYLITLALLAVASCDGPAKTTQPRARPSIGEPSMTASNGVTQTNLGRANLGTAHVHSNFDGFDVELKAQDNTDVSMGAQTIAPGGSTGWHAHPGLVVVVIKSGALTMYHASDPSCTATVYQAGTVVIESDADVHIARNEGIANLEFVSTQYLPAGAAARIDAPAPGNCPF